MAYLEYVHVQPRSENLLLSLGQALHFSAADLLENRRGRLSGPQFRRLANQTVLIPLCGFLLSLFVPVILRIGWLLGVEERSFARFLWGALADPSTILRQSNGPIEEPIPVLFWVVVCIFPLIAAHFLTKMPWILFADLMQRRVLQETGLASNRWDEKRLRGKRGREGDLISSYEYVLNGKRFRVSRAAFEALAPSLEYVVYYLPNSRIVVAVEPKDTVGKQFDPNAKGFELPSKKRFSRPS